MKVSFTSRPKECLESWDYKSYYKIHVNDKEVFCVNDGEPEDNFLARNFNDVFTIPELIRQAHTAGLRNEPLVIVHTEDEEF